jgi:septum site-determining protein MinC
VITHPVRSGQRVVAPDGDLIVLASVNSGAEILARGSIHVYGALRGRALAGVRGDAAARICCLQFHPELVAVAGEYMLHDELDPALLGKAAVVALAGDRLQVEPLGTFVFGG